MSDNTTQPNIPNQIDAIAEEISKLKATYTDDAHKIAEIQNALDSLFHARIMIDNAVNY